jgi:hypothetical protein
MLTEAVTQKRMYRLAPVSADSVYVVSFIHGSLWPEEKLEN